MQLEKLQDKKTPEQVDYESFVEKMKKPVFLKEGPLKGLKKVSQLSPDHKTKQLVDSRKIPTPYHAKLFNCPNFKQFTNNLVPGKFDEESNKHDETRLLIPFINEKKQVHAYQGRALGQSKVKYITIILDNSVPKVYGLDNVNFTKRYYVFEGPIDSMFIPNSVATAGGDLVSAIGTLSLLQNAVIVYDNEPRNTDTVKKMDKAIINGYSVCVWPKSMEFKDVNDMVMGGLSPEFVQYVIDTNTHRDLKAKMALNLWSKS